jgi:polysaccharide biosynthesis protein PslH
LRVALITNDVPFPPHKNGGANTIYNLFKRIKNIKVDLIVVGYSSEAEELNQSKPYLERVFKSVIFHKIENKENKLLLLFQAVFTMQTLRAIKVYDKRLNKILDQYDAIFIHDFPLIKYCTIDKENKIFFICDSQIKLLDSYIKNEQNFIKKLILKYKKFVYKNMINKNYKNFGKLLYISEVDLQYDKKVFPHLENMFFINNGVDTDYFNPSSHPYYEYDLIFLGNFRYRPNYEAAKFIVEYLVPKLKIKNPNIKCVLVGKNPPEDLKKYTSDNIIITGFVEDTRPYIDASKIFISPLFSGAGMKNKILEAMAMNKIIVGTEISFEGISFVSNGNFLVNSDNKKKFITLIENILDNFDKINQCVENRSKVLLEYSWEQQADKLLHILSKYDS